jgi:phytoene synthase
MSTTRQDDYDYCERLVRENDRELWLACLFAPAPARKYIHAIYAFVIETGEVRQKVSQPLLGEMRLRWWRDIIDPNASTPAEAPPVAAALLDAAKNFDLPRDEFTMLLDARIFDLYDDPMPTVAALEDYCRATAAAPIRWAGKILGASCASSIAAFEDAGVALGLTKILRGRTIAFIPRELLATDSQTTARRQLAALARDKYDNARSAAGRLTAAREALLPAATVPLYLEQLARTGYDPDVALSEPSPLRRQWRLWRASRGGGL